MGWSEIFPLSGLSGGVALKTPVHVSSNGANTKNRHWLLVSIRDDVFDMPWLVADGRCKVERGEGAHDRQIRLSKGDVFQLHKAPGKSSRLVVRLAPMPKQTPDKQGPSTVAAEVSEGALIITLPVWCFSADIGAPKPFKLGAPSHLETLRSRDVPGAR